MRQAGDERAQLLGGDHLVDRVVDRRARDAPRRASARRRRAPAGVDENDTYWFSGVCLLRVAVFTAVMIWRVMQSSAKLRKLDSRSVR